MLRSEIYRAIVSPMFLLALAIGLLAIGFELYGYCAVPDYVKARVHPFMCNTYIAFTVAERSPLLLVVPLIAVLPAADSYALDRGQGFLRFVLMRTSFQRYLAAKFLANLMAGGLALALPLLLAFAYTNVRYPRGLLPIDEEILLPGGMPDGPLGYLYRSTPDLYILFLIGLAFLVGATYATFGLSIASITASRYVALATPFLLYHVANFALANLGWEEWTPPVSVYPDMVNSSTWLSVFGQLGLLFGGSILIMLVFARRRRVYP